MSVSDDEICADRIYLQMMCPIWQPAT